MNHTVKPLHVHLIGCGVLRIDFAALPKKPGVKYTASWLEGGLHARPAELRIRLQREIDGVDEADLIAVGYGLCGRGTVDIHAKDIPLAIPRVHDCISLFLGSDEAYAREFARNPGTYYMSAGWYEEKVQPDQTAADHGKTPPKAGSRNIEYLVEKYGEENAREIDHFLSSWQRNYSRSVFIDTGSAKKAVYREYAKDMAQAYGWEYQKLDGNLDLLEALLSLEKDERILRVPPGYMTAFDPMTRTLIALPEAAAATGDANRIHDSEPPDGTTGTPKYRAAGGGARKSLKKGFGLGIDAGGTYTDVAVFNFETREVVNSAKALTTKWDYTVGINNALDLLDAGWSPRIELVAISTTLATNAIVEGTGRTTGLILMPPPGTDAGEFSYPAAIIAGRLDINGAEIEPVDAAEVKRVAIEMRKKQHIEAFAVSGYAGAINPAHEIMVRNLIVEATGFDVCCGHELSDLLDFRVRAHTAALNAGIIPLIEGFLEDAGGCLSARGIDAPIMVVKGDGTLMRESRARLHPVQTILSGPAASLAGAIYLTDERYGTVVDVGGTTSDIGRIDNGRVNVSAKGAVVGRWRTHVRAVDMHTLGLGGDSEVFIEKQLLHLGPKRVAPVCWLASVHDCGAAFNHIKTQPDAYAYDTRLAELLIATGKNSGLQLSEQEVRILELLEANPMTVIQLVKALGLGHPASLQIKRLEADFAVQRCGITPTDLLHRAGLAMLWDVEATREYLAAVSATAAKSLDELHDEVFSVITERLMFELVKRQLRLEYTGEDLKDSETGQAIFDTLLKGGNPDLDISARLDKPVIGLGAAAVYFLEEPARRLSATLTVPRYAEVANAVGAITSHVHVSRNGTISPSQDGLYLISGVAERRKFKSLHEAHHSLVGMLQEDVLTLAKDAGTDERQVKIEYEDNIGEAADGTKVFIGRSVKVGITGAPTAAAEPGAGSPPGC